MNAPNPTNSPTRYNVAQALDEMAAQSPFRRAVVFPAGRDAAGRAKFVQFSFRQLNDLVNSYAHGLAGYGIEQGERTLLMIRPGVEMIAVAFALLKIGAVPVIIDPGMGRKAFLQCIAETEPTAFVGISLAHVLRKLFPRSFRSIKRTVTVGKRWFWGGATLDQLKVEWLGDFPLAPTTVESEGAVAFTSGSTGIPKGVVFLHGTFRAQIKFLGNDIGIQAGEVDMPGLPIFALFNPALGVTTIIPDMDARKPAELNPAYWVESIQTHGVTNSFGSPTIWKVVAKYCRDNDIQLPSLRRVFMAGAPVPPSLIQVMTERVMNGGEVYTPFGATEALPVSNITGAEILAETAALTEQGWGVCVGRPLDGLEVQIISISDEVIERWDDSLALPAGDLGEIVVKGPVVTREYLHRPEQTRLAKIYGENGDVWHRMGDLGYFDTRGRLWMCGRKAHRVETETDLMLPVPCEAIFNAHPEVARTALVGIGPPGQQRPLLVVELASGEIPSDTARRCLIDELLALGKEYQHTSQITKFMFHKSFPVDVRHNVKIQREKLAAWAATQVK
jgi:acyl-CoA synthetase (AMP-forming)/AMP-acid ligase II